VIPGEIDRREAVARAWDVLVVGGGPAGAMAARELARSGREVLLVDRSRFPRDKVCGACLNARSLDLLARAGLLDQLVEVGARPIAAFELVTAAGNARVDLPRGAALSRRRLDLVLIESAGRAGVRLLTGSRALLGPCEEGLRRVRLPEHGDELSARVVLAADGLSGGFLPEAAMPRVAAGGSRLGAWAILEAGRDPQAGPPAGTIAMAVSEEGYVGAVRVENGAINLAAALDRGRVATHGLAGAVARILEQSGAVAPCPEAIRAASWRGTGPLTRRPLDVAMERVLLIGDAAGYVEPFTGEGMTWALESALAVSPLAERAAAEWSPALAGEWRRTYGRAIARRQRWCRWMATGLRSPRWVHRAVRVLALSPRLAAPLVRKLGGRDSVRMAEPAEAWP
jgi:flavin-dependent dehydrogenase